MNLLLIINSRIVQSAKDNKAIFAVIIGLAPFFDFIFARQVGLLQEMNINGVTRNFNLPIIQFAILVVSILNTKTYLRLRQSILFIILAVFAIRFDTLFIINLLMIIYAFLVFHWLYKANKALYVNIIFITYIITGICAFFIRIFVEGVSYDQARYGLNIFGGYPMLMTLIMLMQFNYQNDSRISLFKIFSLLASISIVFSSRTGMLLVAALSTTFIKLANILSIIMIAAALVIMIPGELFEFTYFRIMLLVNNFSGISTVLLENGALFGRIRPWLEGWEIAVDNPFFGIGYGRYFFASGNGYSNPHNEIIHLLAQMGFLFGSITTTFLIFAMLPRRRFTYRGTLFFLIWLIGMLVSGLSLTQFPGIHASMNLLMIFITLERQKWR